MKKNIFGLTCRSGAIRIDSFFAELVLIIPVFAVSCCAALELLSSAARKAEAEEAKAAAIACAQSWCELYSMNGSIEECAEAIFGTEATSGINGVKGVFTLDGGLTAKVSESTEETRNGSMVYGQLCTSEITVSWDGGEITQSAVKYFPYSATIYSEEEEEQ